MLALPPLRNSKAEEKEGFSDAVLGDDVLDSIDFSCIFENFDVDGEELFPTEIQFSEPQRLLAEFSAEGEEQENGTQSHKKVEKREESKTMKRSHGKKKVKVDWTPELHRRFVEAVEQLGVDKAVPSRILEIMGIQNLTRHNVASHLQKYRSHHKHLLAREAEAACWTQRRQIYAAAAGSHNTRSIIIKKENSTRIAPTIGYPPPPPPPPLHPQFIPLHVWGHPTADRRPMFQAMWTTGHAAPHSWPPQLPNFIGYPQPHYRGAAEVWGPSAVISTPHFMPFQLPALRFAPPPVAGVLPHPIYGSQHLVSPLKKHSNLQPEHSDYPSTESIDAAIGDVLAEPWLPLPLGLKPPSTDSVLIELQRQGVSKVQLGCNPNGNKLQP